MKKILIAIGAVLVLLVLAVLIVPALIPVETYKTELLAQVKEATGREARIDGDFSLSILPSVAFSAGKVSFANAPGGKAAQMVTLDRLDVKVALFPLLGGNVEIDSFVLLKPVIHLEIDKSGRPNWQFGAAKSAGTKAPSSRRATRVESGDGGGVGLSGLRLGDVRLVDGSLSHSDAQAGTHQKIDGINLKISLPSLDSPMKAEGSLMWNKENIALGFGLSNPNAFLNGRRTKIGANITATTVKLSFKGSASGGKPLKAGGALDLDVPSIRKLAAWVGSPLDAPGTGLGPLKIAGTVDVNGKRYAFKKANLSVDAIRGQGDFAFDGGGRKPVVSAALKLNTLDLNPYLPPEKKPAPGGAARPAAAGAGAAPAKSDWSDDPIDLSALNAVDAGLDLTVAGLVVRKIKIGESSLKVTLRNGVLVTDLTRMALYGGTGKAKLTANASRPVPSVALSFDLAKFQANPFMTDAMDFDRIEGTANADLSVVTSGGTQRRLVSALSGGGKVQFLDGAIRGINLAAMVRNIATAFLDSKAGERQKTDFAELGGTFRITRGILRNDDLLLKSPLLRLAGKGIVDLPKRRVKYRVEPKVVASVKGQGGAADSGGIKVPVNVEGPWDDISYTPDLGAAIGGLVTDPGKALNTLKNAIPGVGGGSSGATTSSPLPIPKPEEMLKKLFGR